VLGSVKGGYEDAPLTDPARSLHGRRTHPRRADATSIPPGGKAGAFWPPSGAEAHSVIRGGNARGILMILMGVSRYHRLFMNSASTQHTRSCGRYVWRDLLRLGVSA
jgi:hypothetical protein